LSLPFLCCLVALGKMNVSSQCDPDTQSQDEPKELTENDEERNCVPKKSCGPDEEYRCCGPCYQLACLGSVIECQNRCYADCYCVKGFIREFPGGPCVPDLFCPLVDLPSLSEYDDYDV
uniref:TIL domain-containing protein n=1 Tax=Anopheles atroparvus TaxID=41427 RepID=A0AAG5CSY4_ANOAO